MNNLFLLVPLFIWATAAEKCQDFELKVQMNSYYINATKVNTVFVNHNVPVICESLWRNITEVAYLSIANASIKELEVGAFLPLSNLKTLKLNKNEIEKIIPGVFENLTVVDINLAENQISVLEKNSFVKMFSLKDIDLSENLISELQANWFVECPELKKLRLYNNQIKEIASTTFENLNPKLSIWILLGGNDITTISPHAFDKLEDVTELTLHGNQLEELPDDFLKNLKHASLLDFGLNKLKCISQEVLRKSDLTFLTGNPISDQCVEVIKSVISKYRVAVYLEKLKPNNTM